MPGSITSRTTRSGSRALDHARARRRRRRPRACRAPRARGSGRRPRARSARRRRRGPLPSSHCAASVGYAEMNKTMFRSPSAGRKSCRLPSDDVHRRRRIDEAIPRPRRPRSHSRQLRSRCPALAADGPVKTFSQDVTLGFYRGQVVSYLDFGPGEAEGREQDRADLGVHERRRRPAQHHRHRAGSEGLHAALGGAARDLEGRRDVRVLRSAAAVARAQRPVS